MSAESVIATELQAARKASGLSRERVAALLSVSAKSVERWELSGKVGAAQLRALRALYADTLTGRISLDNGVPRGTPTFEESTYLPARLLDLARRFGIEIARVGAENEEIDHVDRTLRSEHLAILVNQRPDGSRRSPDEQDAEFRLQLRALLRWLVMRMQFLGRKPIRPLDDVEALIGPPLITKAIPGGRREQRVGPDDEGQKIG